MHKPKGKVMMVIIGGGGASGPSLKPKGSCGEKRKSHTMISIPTSALGGNDESGEVVAPEVGDNVTLNNVEAMVKSINGDKAEVEILAVNGEAAEYVERGDSNPERESILEDAMELDREAGYEE